MENEPWYKKCIRCKNRMFGICMDVTIKQFAENGSICPLWEEKTMEIKPCPSCGSDSKLRVGGPILGKRYVVCNNCGAYGPNGNSEDEAIERWNSAPRKEDVEMGKSCANCVHISKEVNGKVYCCEEININHSCKYWEGLNPFGNSRPICLDCKHRYYLWGGDNICNYCGREIGKPEGYVCDKWVAKESKSTPLNTSNKK